MKLTDLTTPANLIREGQVEPNVLLSVRNIVERGRANNTFEFMIMARLLQMIKHGTFYKETNPFEVNMSTSKDVLDTLRNLPDKDMLGLAKRVYDLLTLKDQDAMRDMINPEQDFMYWIKLATAREAND